MDNSINGLFIFTGNSNPILTKRICEYLDMPLGGAKVKTFSDGEIQIEIDENVRCFRCSVDLPACERQSC